jgi:hypothetical protein
MTLEEEQSLTIHHYENDTWINITYSVDTDASIICGLAESLSPFVIAIPLYVCGDVDCNSKCNVSDAVGIINYVFIGGNEPCETSGDGIPDWRF